MELLVTPSKTEQITAILRSQIKKGHYSPGSRLASVRQLAERFKVSTRIIGCALELLQQERLIRSEHGRGVFIEQRSEDGVINVYMLFWGMEEHKNNYFDEIAKIAYPPIMPSDFSFNLRAVMKNSSEFSHLDAELAKIDNSPDIDCAIFGSVPFNLEHISKFKKLQCPFIMLGDFQSANMNDIDINHITGDSFMQGSHCLKFMNERGFKEISLVSLDTHRWHFYKQFADGVKDAGTNAGIKVNFLEMPEDTHLDINNDSAIKENYKQFFKDVSSDFFDVPIILMGLRENILIDVLSEQNKLSDHLPIILPRFDSNCFSGFYKSIYNMIKKVVKEPQVHHKERIDIPFIIKDLVNNKKYLNNQGGICEIN